MLTNLIHFAVRQRAFILIAAVVLAAFGVRAALELPIEAFPDVQDTQVQIVTQAPGLAPEEIERTITLPIEREMSGVPRQTNLRSVTITGLSIVTLTFADGTDDYFVRQQVLERLGNVNLPTGVQPQLAPLSTAVGEIYRYVLEAPPDMPQYEVRALQDWLIRPLIRMTPGVVDVVSFGGTIKEYQVRIDPYALKRYAVTIDQVSQALTNNSANVGGGLLRRGSESLVIRGIGLFNNASDIGRVIVAARGGKTIFVSDLAEVAIGERPKSGIVGLTLKEPAKEGAPAEGDGSRQRVDSRDSIVQGIVLMTKGQNPSLVIAALKDKLEEVRHRLPPGVQLREIYDRTSLIRHTVSTVTENLTVGAMLVTGVLMIFLRNWRAALIVAVVIPLSLLFALIVMNARGVSANLISLGTVDFGIIVDAAVVLIEALMVKLALAEQRGGVQDYAHRLATLKETAVEMVHPILFSTAIIVFAFMPIYTFQRVEGKIFAPVAFTFSFAMLGAIILSITLVPALAAFAIRGHGMAERHSAWIENLKMRYRALLLWTPKHRFAVAASALAALGAALAMAAHLGTEFLPKLDEGNIWLTITMPTQTGLEQTKQIEREVRAILSSYPEVTKVITQVGRPDDGTDPKGPNNLEVLADLAPHGEWRAQWHGEKELLIVDMSRRIHKLPGVPTNFSQVIQDNVEETLSGVKGEIAVKVFGPDLDILQAKADQIAAILSGIRGAADVAAIKTGGQTELLVTLDRDKIARFGINVADANAVIQTALAGNAVNAFYEGDRRWDVTLRLQEPYRDAVDDIGNLQVALPGGANTVSLGALADIQIRQGAGRIMREAGGRNASVKANLIARDQGSFVAEAQAKVAAQVALPPGYYITWGGQFENQQRALKRLKVIIPLSVLTIFGLLFWAFRSIRKALLVLAMVPFASIGGLLGLEAAGLNLSISAAVGFIAVAGIAVQNGVIMVEQIIEFGRQGRSLADSVIEGAVLRMRPVMMTAITAFLGLLPAAVSHGIGSETQRPFAVVIVGGIVSATLFTLVLLPLLYPLFAEEGDAVRQAGGVPVPA
jgi:cobalt-zinc-cadmium resistance protein CzcA